MRKLLQPAILFCVLLILFSGCGTAESEDQNLDHIRISNLKTSSSVLSQEEQAYMNEISSILSAVKLMRNESNNITFSVQNTSQHDLDISLYFDVIDGDGCLTETDVSHIYGWEKGQKLSDSVYCTAEAETLTLIGEYVFDGIVYMTDPITLPVTLGQEEPGITLNYKGNLPTVVSLEQSQSQVVSYSLLDFSLETDTSSSYQSLELLIRKENGKDNDMDYIPVRIVDKDGHVHYSGSDYIYLNRGETAKMVFIVSIYEPGEYYLELK